MDDFVQILPTAVYEHAERRGMALDAFSKVELKQKIKLTEFHTSTNTIYQSGQITTAYNPRKAGKWHMTKETISFTTLVRFSHNTPLCKHSKQWRSFLRKPLRASLSFHCFCIYLRYQGLDMLEVEFMGINVTRLSGLVSSSS